MMYLIRMKLACRRRSKLTKIIEGKVFYLINLIDKT